MGVEMIKGFYVDAEGQVKTFEAEGKMILPNPPKPDKDAEVLELKGEVVETRESRRRGWKSRRKNQIRRRVVLGSVGVALLGAIGFALTLGGEDPNWAVGIVGAAVNMGWVLTVIGANGGEINVE